MSDIHDPRYDDLLPAYSLGALEEGERAELEAHLAGGCARCEAILASCHRVVDELAATVPPVEPSPHVRRRLLAALPPREGAGAPAGGAAEARLRPDAERAGGVAPAWRWAALAATLVAVAGLALGAWRADHLGERLGAERERHAAELGELRERLAEERRRAAIQAEMIAVMGARDVVTVPLQGLAGAPQAFARAAVRPGGELGVLTAFRLPPAPAGRTYQLWTIPDDGRPRPAGVFEPDAGGTATLLVENVGPAQEIPNWAVSVEPEGGSEQPTGEIVMLGP